MIPPETEGIISTGWKITIPQDRASFVMPDREQNLYHRGLYVIVSALDPGFTGELQVRLANNKSDEYGVIQTGECVASLVIFDVPTTGLLHTSSSVEN